MREEVTGDEPLPIVLPPVVPRLERRTDLRCAVCRGWVTVDADQVSWLFSRTGNAPRAMHESCYEFKYGRKTGRPGKSPGA